MVKDRPRRYTFDDGDHGKGKTMRHVSLDQAETGLRGLLERVEAGEVVVITRDGSPIARLSPASAEKRTLRPMAEFRARMPRLRRPSSELLRECRDDAL